MIARVLALLGGLAGGASLSQFPEYSQQYIQRLAGAVDELTLFVTEFDADAASVGLSRDEALQELGASGELGAARAETIGTTVQRYERMKDALEVLQTAGPFTRAYNAVQFNDLDIAQAAMDDFKPAVPLNFEGVVFTGIGFLTGWLVIGLVLGLLGRVIFGRRAARAS
jgi:hypothetical protein